MIEKSPVDDELRALVEDIYAVDAADTAAALGAAWRGFDAIDAAGGLLADCHVDYAALCRRARPILDLVDDVLTAAPSLPGDVKPLTLNLVGERTVPLSHHVACAVHRDMLDVAYGLVMLLPAVAAHADEADRRACRQSARLAYDLVNCYEGRLNPFLSAYPH